ncbi:NAD(P)H-binding protein [Saccharothrix sp. S26]|uniref:NAD(P)H-binding protein n=1 Tax=Saccharothrix sp. S26 TaxID=2907215 RepID=UPI001F2062AD|nr:NAD(P)H-binding protein [Saccharothrix sp. S26]MCE6997026.1 NAD(P)H-binding protein [Saccharothrix sp. S26]
MADPSILVLGATGSTGRRVAARLTAAGRTVRRASRRGDVRFDWADRDTWADALDGVDRVYLMAPHELPVEPDFVHEAVARGVRRFVLLSTRGVVEMRDERLLAAERLVREAGVGWTALRPDWFDQNFDEGFLRPAVLAGELVLPLGGKRQAFVDADDIAAVAVAALTEDGHEGEVYEVTGPEALSFPRALAELAEVTGRHVEFRGTPDDYRAVMPAELAEEQIRAWDALGDGEPTDVVARVTGREPTSFRDYAARAWAAGAWREPASASGPFGAVSCAERPSR